MEEKTDKPTSGKFRLTRRKFLRGLAGAAAAGALGAAINALRSPSRYKITAPAIRIKRLPEAFDGFTIALLTDIHHGPSVDIEYVDQIVRETNRLAPDLVLLGGDYVFHSAEYYPPCVKSLANLQAPAGVFFLLGNHDHWNRSWPLRRILRKSAHELINEGTEIRRGNERIFLAGVDDLWTGKPRIDHFLKKLHSDAVCILGSHNPDYAELVKDERVRLILSGHTHGGQIYIPGIGAPILPSKFGQKYRAGLVTNGPTQVYVSRGLGTIPPRARFCCPPELALIKLRCG